MILYIHKFMVQSPEHSKFRRFEMVIGEQTFPRPAKLENNSTLIWASRVAQLVKNLPANAETQEMWV